MGKRKSNSTAKLRNELEVIIKKGKENGLSDSEIRNCISCAKTRVKSRHTSLLRKLIVVIRCLFYGFILFIALIVFITVLTSVHRPSEKFVENRLSGFLYPLMRAVRLTTLPISQRLDMGYIYYKQCLIQNPFHNDVVMCWACEDVKEVTELKNITAEDFGKEYHHFGSLFVWQQGIPHDVTMAEFLSTVHSHPNLFSATMFLMSSSSPTIQSAQDLLDPQLATEAVTASSMSLQWKVMGVGGVRLIRLLSWKPSFISENSEFSSEMFINMLGPEGDSLQVPDTNNDNVWLSQSVGHSKVVLAPKPFCRSNCTEMTVALQEKDVLYYNSRYWQPKIYPEGSSPSVQFIGSFT